MAELLTTQEWLPDDALGLHLQDALPFDYVILSEPVVFGTPLDTIVVGPQGMTVLYPRSWEGRITIEPRGPWKGELPSGRAVAYPDAAEQTPVATKAVQSFLKDEAPSLVLPVRHIFVLTDPDVAIEGGEHSGDTKASGLDEPAAVRLDSLAATILSADREAGDPVVDETTRRELALALRDHRLTVNQRASQPFIFRSGGRFGAGKRVWTLREMADHLDRHPDDGIHHMRNRTLIDWLADQGADHLDELARELMRDPGLDARARLELFLIKSGLVARPKVRTQPKRVRLGYALPGQSPAGRLRVRKGRGRGFLFGSLEASEDWLKVHPGSLEGDRTEVTVSADTGDLFISPSPYEAAVLIDSSASETPISVPVKLQIVGMPSSTQRRVLRPLAGLAAAGAVGALVGWAMGMSGLGAPPWMTGLATPPLAPSAVWALAVGLLWAIFGAVLGANQNPAWPIRYALYRWGLRTAIWGALMALVAWLAHACWRRYGPVLDAAPSVGSVLLAAVAVSIIPSAVGEARAALEERAVPAEASSRFPWRLALRSLLAAGLAILAALAVHAAGPIWSAYDLGPRAAEARVRFLEQWAEWEDGVNSLYDQVVARYYERPASEREWNPREWIGLDE